MGWLRKLSKEILKIKFFKIFFASFSRIFKCRVSLALL